jgi:glycosyltransferase involved in cell wall biosynthesis
LNNIPFLLVSDSVTSPTGLGRVARESAIRICKIKSDETDSSGLTLPLFDFATAGYGGTYSKKFPFHQYPFSKLQDWTIPELPQIWYDHAGDREGIIFFIWNASWLPWFTDPSRIQNGDLRTLLEKKPWKTWLYAPVDSEGPNRRLSEDEAKVFSKFDRVIAYTQFGARAIEKTLDAHAKDGIEFHRIEHLPHGTDGSIFFPRSREQARETFIPRVLNKPGKIMPDILLVGVCATNTPRKDWPLAFETCKILIDRGHNVGLWAHTDRFQRNWNLPALADEFGMRQRVIFSNCNLKDEDLAWAYAACNVTLGIGSEGWGLPISESLAMGVPCITGNYAGATQFTDESLMVDPIAYRYDGYYNSKRPDFRAADWADAVERFPNGGRHSLLNSCYLWENCWNEWEKWLREGVPNEEHSQLSSLSV